MVNRINLKELSNAIFGETISDFSELDFCKWKQNAIRELTNLKNGRTYDEYIINDIINYLSNVNIMREEFMLDGKELNIEELETIYNYMYQEKSTFNDYIRMSKMEQDKKMKSLLDFFNDIVENTISVTICDNRDELIYKLFVDGCDNQEIVENFNFLIHKLETNTEYSLEKIKNILKIGDRYFIVK